VAGGTLFATCPFEALKERRRERDHQAICLPAAGRGGAGEFLEEGGTGYTAVRRSAFSDPGVG